MTPARTSPVRPARLLSLSLAVAALCAGLSGCAGGDGTGVGSKYDQGYRQGSNDSVKRHYWLKQNLEKSQDGSVDGTAARPAYYTLPGPRETADGVKLAPHPLTAEIVE